MEGDSNLLVGLTRKQPSDLIFNMNNESRIIFLINNDVSSLWVGEEGAANIFRLSSFICTSNEVPMSVPTKSRKNSHHNLAVVNGVSFSCPCDPHSFQFLCCGSYLSCR